MRIENRPFDWRFSRISFFESGLEYWTTLEIVGMVLGAQGAFGVTTAFFGAILRVVVFSTFDAFRIVMTMVFHVIIVALKRAKFLNVWFLHRHFYVAKRCQECRCCCFEVQPLQIIK